MVGVVEFEAALAEAGCCADACLPKEEMIISNKTAQVALRILVLLEIRDYESDSKFGQSLLDQRINPMVRPTAMSASAR